MKYSFPRSDLRVTVRGVQLKPALALGGWIAFERVAGDAIVMGDLVLTEDEVGPVMRALQQHGVEQTALHNHVLGESPGVMYLHVHGQGDPVKLAEAVRVALGRKQDTPAGAGRLPHGRDRAGHGGAGAHAGSCRQGERRRFSGQHPPARGDP